MHSDAMPNPLNQGGQRVKLPIDKVNIHLVPGSVLRVRVDIRRLDDFGVRMTGEIDVVAPKTSEGESTSEKLTQAVEPVSLLETLVAQQDRDAMRAEALSQGHPTEPMITEWFLTNPGVFNEFTAVRDMMGWSNRRAWNCMFAGDTPIYLPTHLRAEKMLIWEALPREERIRRAAAWRKQRGKNKARYETYTAMISEAIQNINHHIGGPFPLRIEAIPRDDRHVPDKVSEPWLSRHTTLYRTIRLDMDIEEARADACRRAVERGRQATERSRGEDVKHPEFGGGDPL